MTTLHAWIFDHPFCSAGCLADAEREGLVPSAPSPAVAFAAVTAAIDQAYGSLQECGRGNVALARMLESHSTNVAVTKFATRVTVGPLGSALAAAAMEAPVEHAISRQEDAHWALEQHLATLTRALMMLHGLGYPIAPKMPPLFTDHASLAPAGTDDADRQLQALRAILEDLGRCVHGWLSAQ